MTETIKTLSKIAYPINTILFDETTQEAFTVKECHSMFLMSGGEKSGFGLVLEKVEIKKELQQ